MSFTSGDSACMCTGIAGALPCTVLVVPPSYYYSIVCAILVICVCISLRHPSKGGGLSHRLSAVGTIYLFHYWLCPNFCCCCWMTMCTCLKLLLLVFVIIGDVKGIFILCALHYTGGPHLSPAPCLFCMHAYVYFVYIYEVCIQYKYKYLVILYCVHAFLF